MGQRSDFSRYVFNPAFFTIQMSVNMVLGGLLAAALMRPFVEAGPVRLVTYALLGIGSAVLAYRYIRLVRQNADGKATLLVVASCWTWLSFTATGFAVLYLLIAENWGLWPNWGESITERIIYFFISGTAIGVMYKALIFSVLGDEDLVSRRVWAWPFSAFVHRHDEKGEPEQTEAEMTREIRDSMREQRSESREDRPAEQQDRDEGSSHRNPEG